MTLGTSHLAETRPSASPLEAFQWTPQPEAERLVGELISPYVESSPELQRLKHRLEAEAGVRLVDLVDHVDVPSDRWWLFDPLTQAGYVEAEAGVFPPLARTSYPQLYIRVESVIDFLAVIGADNDIEGGPMCAFRRSSWLPGVSVIERHGLRDLKSKTEMGTDEVVRVLAVLEDFRVRRRHFEPPEIGFDLAENLIDGSGIGVDRACDLFFAAEREYWQRRNRAAQVQKARQDRLGIGWANHDHHTYRSSRQHFARLILIFEKLGFHCRERFYAGKQAGWGAQVLEQPNAGIVIFADVDLSPDELLVDFAHEPLPERQQLGTVGLWCALHGESFLEAGMHHLECQFDFDALRGQLESEAGIRTMKPFTDFPHLRQAFTEGEWWPVREDRIVRLLEKGQITPEQAETFRTKGAVGSHLENLERNQGFKGFNQSGVSEIIAATDPRRLSQ
jgi:hypothetical protein